MRKVVIIGVGMTQFGKFLNTSLEELGRVAIWNAIKDAGIHPGEIQAAHVANSMAGPIMGRVGVIGQGVLAHSGIGGISVTNVENLCAGGSTALRGAYLEVASGSSDVALAVGVEKMHCGDLAIPIAAMASNTPYTEMGFQFTAAYAMELRRYMAAYDVTREHFAKVVEKNSYNGSLNPYAQHSKPLSVEEVLKSRVIAEPLTLYMCASIADGAAAVVVCAEEVAGKYTKKRLVEVAACVLRSGVYRKQKKGDHDIHTATRTAYEAYEKAGVAPEEIDLAEVHDAMAPAELLLYEQLGFCNPGEGSRLIDEGRTRITGDKPVNPSGGLAAKGHPISATGLAQAAEIVWQLRGEAGKRQVKDPKIGLTENAGGHTQFDDYGACSIVILKKAE